MSRSRTPDGAWKAPPTSAEDLTWASFTLLRRLLIAIMPTSDGGTRISEEEARELRPLLRRLLRVVDGVLSAEDAMATGPLSPDRLT